MLMYENTPGVPERIKKGSGQLIFIKAETVLKRIHVT